VSQDITPLVLVEKLRKKWGKEIGNDQSSLIIACAQLNFLSWLTIEYNNAYLDIKMKRRFNYNMKLLIPLVIGLVVFLIGGGVFLYGNVISNNESDPGNSEKTSINENFVDENEEDFERSEVAGERESLEDQGEDVIPSEEEVAQVPTTPAPRYKQFTGQQFVSFYDSYQYSNVSSITQKPFITGDVAIDTYIQNLAESRGYKLRAESLSMSNQSQLTTAVSQLQTAAAQEAGLNFVFVSGYRSVADQRNIFLSVMNEVGVNRSRILSGSEDTKLDSILKTRSIPGYSKHHTGYTVDFGCNSYDLVGFGSTACYQWISANNYENAKRFGLIPSYPQGAQNQGPNPEQWEYVWVGEKTLLN